MLNDIKRGSTKGVALFGGSRLEQLGFAETIRAQYDVLGFENVDMSVDYDCEVATTKKPFPIRYDQVGVIIYEENSLAEEKRAKALIERLRPRIVILGLRDPEIVLRPSEWPTNLRGIVKWAEICDRIEAFLLPVSEGLTVYDTGLVDLNVPSGREGITGENAELFASLTRREKEVAKEISQGSINRSIAENLGITINTVNTHVNSLISKLGVSNRTEVAVWYLGCNKGNQL